ncbi:relaxase/mobilization nuclease domain protein [Klebsiella pneumoniae VAKPC270]|nr:MULTISPECIES: MobP1 family relaxase [Enterobacterales]EOZ46882.1 relaxase/mobilization nuclease domain protein [Klebsiella pneumoniae VAKPC276]EOZ49116.1 relaxase/mobilization nuclease domain protein [Klebsiella pneumoniae VAKPC270]RNP56287.1 spore coat protein CotH [Klebsiella pneumoniae]RNS18894.1 spore coat protein CotH [Klebsiella pneumoniae]RNU47049.1 spore coat protein CotH [Klebsiella pneumoniae]
MGVNIEKEYLVKRSRSAKGQSLKKSIQAGKSAFAHKAKKGGKLYGSRVREQIGKHGRSKEVMVKITGSAQIKQGIKNSVNYISREDTLLLTDDEGNKIDAVDAKDYLIQCDDDDTYDSRTSKQPAITKNIIFSPPASAQVSQEDALESVRKTLSEKYPDNKFVMVYHDDKKDHPHVHVILRTDNDDTGKKINIRKKDLRELREGFCEQLKLKGYDVKATHKQIPDFKNKLKEEDAAAPRRQKNVREVVDFGRAPYQFKEGNKPQNYLTVKTLNGKEYTMWGKELGELAEREKIQKGSLIKLKKSGSEEVKVPRLDKNGEQAGWLTTQRNNWQLENIGQKGIDRTQKIGTEKQTDVTEQLKRQQEQQRRFKLQAAEMIKKEQKLKIGLKF